MMMHYVWSYIGIAVSVLLLVGATAWWTYAKYKRKAR